MKNAMMMLVVLFVVAFAGAAEALSPEGREPVVTEKETPFHQAERALFAAPCPGETKLWCVALEPAGPESGLSYSFKKSADDKIVFVRERVARVETVKANFPKNLIKNWGITPSEAILAAYNGEKMPKKTDSAFNWFMLHETTAKLNMWKSTAGDELTFMETEKKENSVSFILIGMAIVLAVIGLSIGQNVKSYLAMAILSAIWPCLLIILVIYAGAFPTTWNNLINSIDAIVMFFLLLPISAFLAHVYKKRAERKDRANIALPHNPTSPVSGQTAP